jgi:hypothetical protein
MHIADYILRRNEDFITKMSDPREREMLRLWKEWGRTEVAVLKCMDGRLTMSHITNTPPGLMQVFRTMGGKFDLGMPWFGELLHQWIEYSSSKNRNCLVFCTYHFSKGNAHRGCRGFNYDRYAAQQAAEQLRRDIAYTYKGANTLVYAIVVGIETDEDALILHSHHAHGVNSSMLDSSESTIPPSTGGYGFNEELEEELERLYLDMPLRMRKDLAAIMSRNVNHIREVRKQKRTPVELDHLEQAICVGDGFHWLNEPNTAFIVGPYSATWHVDVKVAGGIVLESMRDPKRLASMSQDGVALVCASSYREQWRPLMRRAELRARYFAEIAIAVLQKEVPELRFELLIGTVYMGDHSFETLERRSV